MDPVYLSNAYNAFAGVLMNRGKRHLFQWNRGSKATFYGEQRQCWGLGNIRKQIFDFEVTGEQANLFQSNKGTGSLPPERAVHITEGT